MGINETVLMSETIRTNDRISTISLTKHNKRNEWFRYVDSTDEDFNIEMGFTNYKDALARYERDLKGLKV